MNFTKSKILTKFISVILSMAAIISTISFQLTAAYGEEEEIAYAHTMSSPIDLRNIGDGEGQTPAKGDGYEWDSETNTLTLNNLHMDFTGVEIKTGEEFAIQFPVGLPEVTIILNGANKMTDVSIINCINIEKVTLKGGSGNPGNDSLEVVCNDQEKYQKISALGLGRNSYIENLTMKLDLYWGTNWTNLTIKNSDINIKSYESIIYCLGYFRAIDSTLCFTPEGANKHAIMANVADIDSFEPNKPYISDEPINISNCKIMSMAPSGAIMYASKGNAVISDSTIDCKESLVGLYIGDDITISNSDVKNSCLTLDSIRGTINIDESSSIIGVSRDRGNKTVTAYGKYTQTNTLNSNVIGEGYTFTIDENAEITMADGISMQVTGGKLINNGIVKGNVEKTSGTIECNNHCLTEVTNDESGGIHTGKCSICGEENIQAKEITFIFGDNRTTIYAVESKLNKHLIPEVPAAENMQFECWSETKAENAVNEIIPFNFEVPITKDTTLYAVFSRKFTGTDAADVIDLIYNTEILNPINLYDYIKFADENFDSDGQFDFKVSSETPLLDGLELNADGTITGKPAADVKENGYIVKFIVTNKNPYVSLAVLEPETALKEAVLTLNFNIQKADPAVTVKSAENLVYDAKEKVLIDYDNTSITGGNILYSLDNINYSEVLPKGKDANDYTVWYKVIGDKNYNDTEPETITVTIAKADPTVTVKPTENLVYDTEDKVLIDYNNTNTNGGRILYSLDNINYSEELPKGKDANDYTVWYKVIGGKNYNDTEPETITVTIAKADPLYEIPKDLTTHYGKTLANVELPNGFTWNDSTQIAENIGINKFKAIYTPNDTNNYNIITDIDITVNVLLPEKTSPYGDVDGQIGVTVNDASCLLKKVLDNNCRMPIEEEVKEYMTYADVDGDGKLTALDAAMILKKALDSKFILPVECEN